MKSLVAKRVKVKEPEESVVSAIRIPRNEVFLIGRVSGAPVEKLLPSGDFHVEFRIVVDRKGSQNKKREVDALDVAAWLSKARRSALTLKVGDWISVEGAIRRRFWKVPSGVASRWQVEASQLGRL